MSGYYVSRTNLDALIGLFEASSNFSVAATERALLELVIIGRVPLTDFQLNFEQIFVPFVSILWLWFAKKVYLYGVKIILKSRHSKFDIAL